MVEDLRIIKTKRNIENAFLELLNVKDFEKITVKEIAEHSLSCTNIVILSPAFIPLAVAVVGAMYCPKISRIIPQKTTFENPFESRFLFIH